MNLKERESQLADLHSQRTTLAEYVTQLFLRIENAGDIHAEALALLDGEQARPRAENVPALKEELTAKERELAVLDATISIAEGRLAEAWREIRRQKLAVLEKQKGPLVVKQIRALLELPEIIRELRILNSEIKDYGGSSQYPCMWPRGGDFTIHDPSHLLCTLVRDAVHAGHLTGSESWLADVNWRQLRVGSVNWP
jgi:hypothetical protein